MEILRINPGKLTRWITLERLTETVAPSGAVAQDWTPYATVRAELVTQATADYLSGIGEGATGRVTFRLWYRRDVSADDRVTYDGETCAINSMQEIGHRNGLQLMAVTQ